MSYDSSEAEELLKLNRILATTQADKSDQKKDQAPEAAQDDAQVAQDKQAMSLVPREALRKKMDVFLQATSVQIKNLILKQTQEMNFYLSGSSSSECWWWVNSRFA